MIQNLWSTPFLKTKMSPEISSGLSEKFFTEYNLMSPPSDFGVKNILEDDSDIIKRFKHEVVLPSFNSFLRNTLGKDISDWKGGYRTHAWLAGKGNDYSINYHNHSGAQLSAVFYILCEEYNSGGEISFTDPRQNANRGYDSNFSKWFEHHRFTPETGDIVVFPSFLYHFVSTYQGNIRLAVPVDLFLFANS